jgi:hypothetical protein
VETVSLADFVLLIHLGYIMFVVGGGLLALRWRWLPWIHVPAVLWAGFVELSGRVCPLTTLENWLRQGGGSALWGGFIEHYLVPLVYPAELTRLIQIGLGAGVAILNAGIYLVVRKLRRRRERSSVR